MAEPGDRPGSAAEGLGALAAALPSGAADLPWPRWATPLDRAG
jgi:hypothetical protein